MTAQQNKKATHKTTSRSKAIFFLRLYAGMLILTAFVSVAIMHWIIPDTPDDPHGYMIALATMAATVLHWLFGSNIGSEDKTEKIQELIKGDE